MSGKILRAANRVRTHDRQDGATPRCLHQLGTGKVDPPAPVMCRGGVAPAPASRVQAETANSVIMPVDRCGMW
jgi:hypothetical protein